MVKALLLVIILLGTACAYPHPDYYAQHGLYRTMEELCWDIYQGRAPLPGGACDPDSHVVTIDDVYRAQDQGLAAARERAYRRTRPNKYLRYDALQSFHEAFDKDHHD
jgi:hypothetical protein